MQCPFCNHEVCYIRVKPNKVQYNLTIIYSLSTSLNVFLGADFRNIKKGVLLASYMKSYSWYFLIVLIYYPNNLIWNTIKKVSIWGYPELDPHPEIKTSNNFKIIYNLVKFLIFFFFLQRQIMDIRHIFNLPLTNRLNTIFKNIKFCTIILIICLEKYEIYIKRIVYVKWIMIIKFT